MGERLNSGNTNVFAGGMVQRSADDDFALEFLQEAKEHTAELQKVLDAIAELGAMWDQFQLLLEKQGELLNQIGANLEKCKDFVTKANADLDDAQAELDAAQRKSVMTFFCL